MLSEPAIGKSFFGRESILHTLEKRVNALKGGYRQNVALTGQMLSGKSSILRQFLYTLRDSPLIPVYIEVVEEPFPSFADKFIATLLYNYLLSCGKEADKDLASLLKAAEPHIPHTVYAIKKVRLDLSRRNYNKAYRKLLNLTSTLKEEAGKSCVVILDEFHNLESFRIKKPYLHFGKIIMIQKDTMYIVSSSQKSTIRKILSEKLALLFGNFEIIEVSGFDDKTARAFIGEKMQEVSMPEDLVNYLIDFMDGNPFYIDLASKKIHEIAARRSAESADESVIAEAFASLIYNTSGTISQYFTNSIMSLLEKDLREDSLRILIALAHGYSTRKEISKWLNKKNPGGLSGKLARLMEFDMVYKNGVFYDVHDKVFKFWLRTVYHKKKVSLVDDILSKRDDFKTEVKSDIAGYLSESRKDAIERIKDLFCLFNGEAVEIENKTRRLPRFARIEIQKYGKHEDMVTYQKSDKYWVCEVWRDKVDEPAVVDFIERYYPMREKISKKICIALEGIDRNALLLAKEKNVWVWDLGSINRLLRLYKKHNLMRK